MKMGLFRCNRTDHYKCEKFAVRNEYTYETEVKNRSLKLDDHHNTYFNSKYIIQFSSNTNENNHNYTTYSISLLLINSTHIRIDYFDKDERDRDLNILIKLIEND